MPHFRQRLKSRLRAELEPIAGSPLVSPTARQRAKSSRVVACTLSCWKKAMGSPAQRNTEGRLIRWSAS
jgi:hypothetical protein